MLVTFRETEWAKYVKQALEQWHLAAELGQSPLVELDAVQEQLAREPSGSEPQTRAKALRQVLRSAIRMLGVDGEEPPTKTEDPAWFDRRWRYYALLRLRYIEGLHAGLVQSRIGLAEGGQFYREQAKAISLAARVLRDMEGRPGEEEPNALLSYPGGAVALNDRFYVWRKQDHELEAALRLPWNTATIRGPRQVGKTSLLAHGVQSARKHLGARVVYFDLQEIDPEALISLDAFLHTVAEWIVDELELDPGLVDRAWRDNLTAKRKLTNLLGRYVLSEVDTPVLLAMDEIDRLLPTGFHSEFFSLVRSWRNRGAHDVHWGRLSILMVISTEPYLLIRDLNQSPFNVGLTLTLDDFEMADVVDLNQRYGSPLSNPETQELFELLGGHPFLTRVALYTILREQITLADLIAQALKEQGPFGEHLAHQHRLVSTDPDLHKALTEVVQRRQCPDERACFRLLKAGLIKGYGNEYVSRCRLYQQYFREKS